MARDGPTALEGGSSDRLSTSTKEITKRQSVGFTFQTIFNLYKKKVTFKILEFNIISIEPKNVSH